MRARTAALLALATLAASPVAFAQRASLADRVAALEARAAADQGATELVNQIGQLRAETQELRGQIEVLQQQLEQAKQAQRTQYLDLDSRLNRVEGATPATPAATMEPPASDAPVASASPAPAPAAVAGKGERGAYDHAFEALKDGDYVESSRRFRDFLAAFPAGQLAPNALYWLGESYYVTQNYALAGEQFQLLMDRYPTHDKAPGALLKLGLAQLGLKQSAQAEATLRQVVKRYPGSDVARTADDRLRAMPLAGAR